MKKLFKEFSFFMLILTCVFTGGLIVGFQGCSTSTVSTAVNADAVTIASVNAAMGTWSAEVNSGKITNSGAITTVSNAYVAYYNAQLVASNAAALYAASPSTNLQSAVAIAYATALASESNVVSIVNALK